jgi:hypothetical protein
LGFVRAFFPLLGLFPQKLKYFFSVYTHSLKQNTQMSITIKQLEALAEEFNFDIYEARSFLGKEKKRGRPPKRDTEWEYETPKKSPVKKTSPKKSPRETEKSSGKRAPSGYNLFVKNQGVSIVEAAKQWRGLSDSSRDKWNSKAR